MNYSEQILEAVDMVVSQRLKDVNYDKTILCKVVDDTNKTSGEYVVEYENTKMIVYSMADQEEYNNGTEVYVLIPQGDFNLKKIITGKTKYSDLPIYSYTNPLKFLVKVTNNLITTSQVLNKDNTSLKLDDSIVLRSYTEEANMPAIKFLGFAANFQTFGSPLDYTQDYYIEITAKPTLKDTTLTAPDKVSWKFYSSEFIGNPYLFNGKFRQEQIINIEKYSQLENLTINLVNQVSGLQVQVSDFELYYGYDIEELTNNNIYDKMIIYEKDNQNSYQKNSTLFINNIFYQGQQKLKTNDYVIKWYIYNQQSSNTGNGIFWAKLMKSQTEEYSEPSLTLTEGNKNILLLTKSVENNNQFINNAEYPNMDDKAVQVVAQAWKRGTIVIKDETTGKYVTNISNPQDLFGKSDYKNATIWYEAEIDKINTNTEYTADAKAEELEKLLKKYNDDYLSQIVAEEKLVTSNILGIKRSDQLDLEGALKGSGIELVAIDGGNYYIYDGITHKQIDKPSIQNMKIEAKLTGAAKWTEGSTITWKFPMSGSMIENPVITVQKLEGQTMKSYQVWNPKYLQKSDKPGTALLIDDITYYVVSDTAKDYANKQYLLSRGITSSEEKPYQNYNIIENYDLSLVNNIIQCEVNYPTSDEQDEGRVWAGILLNFGIKGAQGTEYTIAITLDKNYIIPGSEIKATGHFYDPSGKELTGKSFIWRWESQTLSNPTDGEEETIGFKNTETVYNLVKLSVGTLTKGYYYKDTTKENPYIEITSDTDKVAQNDSREFYSKEEKMSCQGTDCIITCPNIETLNPSNYNAILSATLSDWQLSNGQKINFKTFIPIPLWSGSNIEGLVCYGATSVVYNFQGLIPQYVDTPYELNGQTANEIIALSSEKQSNIKIADNNTLIVPDIAPTNFPKTTIQLKVNNSQSWYQPIVLYRNEYSSTLLNSWNDGEQFNDGTAILSKIVGAGQKNSEGKFSGVFMGAVGREVANDATTGLYGYQDGVLRFKFTEKGSAYIGDGDNYISFNDGAYNTRNKLKIYTKNFTLKTDNLYLSDTADNNGYLFKLTGNSGQGITLDDKGSLSIGKEVLPPTVESFINYYLVSSDGTNITNENKEFQKDSPKESLSNTKRFLWHYGETIYSDGTTAKSEAIIIGVYGDTGVGQPGTSYYTWIKYSAVENPESKDMQDEPDETTKYMGIAVGQTSAGESSNPDDYTWSLIQGQQGIPGEPGADGKTLYTWIKYSPNSDGTDMTNVPEANSKYIGIAYNKSSQTESNNSTDYTWSLFKGTDGSPGSIVTNTTTYYSYATAQSNKTPNQLTYFPLTDFSAAVQHASEKINTDGYIMTKTVVTYDNGNEHTTGIKYDTYIMFALSNVSGTKVSAGNLIVEKSITARLLQTDAIKSINYNTTNKTGSFLNLADGSFDSPNFKITSGGNVIMSGTITATGGSIGGWIIQPGYFYAPSTKDTNGKVTAYGVGFLTTSNALDSSANNPAFYAGYDITKNTDKTPYPSGKEAWRPHTAVAITHNGRVLFGCDDNNQAIFDFKPDRATQLIIRGSAEITGTIKAGSIIGTITDNKGGVKIETATDDQSSILKLRTLKTGKASGPLAQIEIGEELSNGFIKLSTDVSPNISGGNLAAIEIKYSKISLSCENGWLNVTPSGGHLQGTWTETDGKITASDQRVKNNIEYLPSSYLNLLYALKPVRYKYNYGTSNRYHTGFITQEIEQALNICNIDTQDFAALVGFDRGTENETWGLRYSEFIAINTAAIQAQKKEIDELRAQLTEIKEKLK